MSKISFKIALPIIVAGMFIIASFMALNYESLTSSFYLIFAFLTAYVFLFGFATGQNFTKPVKKLLQNADNLSNGDLKSRVYLESKDELGQLASVFNRIADQLEESNTENEMTKKSVGIKVEAETQSLKEVINALEQKVQNRSLEAQKIMTDLQKCKESSLQRESESAELKRQIADLQEKLEKSGPKKKKLAKTESQQENPEESEEISEPSLPESAKPSEPKKPETII